MDRETALELGLAHALVKIKDQQIEIDMLKNELKERDTQLKETVDGFEKYFNREDYLIQDELNSKNIKCENCGCVCIEEQSYKTVTGFLCIPCSGL